MRKAVVTAALAVLLLAGGAALPATAAIKGPQTTTVSCDGTTVKSGVSVSHATRGPFSIKQNASSPTSNTVTWARSSNGNDLPTQTISNGGTAYWNPVLAGTYTIKAMRSTELNCNGPSFGHGNYDWSYTVTY